MVAVYDSLSRYSLDISKQSASRSADSKKARNYISYTTRDGDTLENLAARHLGSPLLYWELADINPQVKFPFDITPGTVLRIPL